ncbi:MAG: hypothetical protein F9K44_13125, partial [Hyphomicrobiaceae bacterium]
MIRDRDQTSFDRRAIRLATVAQSPRQLGLLAKLAIAIAVLATLSPVKDYVLPQVFPTAALIIDGRLVEASVTAVRPVAFNRSSDGQPSIATITFTGSVYTDLGRSRTTSTRSVVARIELPAEIAHSIRPGDKVIITHHTSMPTLVRYGAVKLGWISDRNLMIVIAAVAAGAFLTWLVRRNRRGSADSMAVHRAFFAMIGMYATLLSYVFLLMAQHELRWELGMR